MSTSLSTQLELQLRNQGIYHYRLFEMIDESQFAGDVDPIIVYRKIYDKYNTVVEQVKVLPFKEEHTSKENLSFQEKMQYYRKKLLSDNHGYGSVTVSNETAEDTEVVQIRDINYGEITDFISAYNGPVVSETLSSYTTESYFDSHFLDLQESTLTEFQTAYENAKV
jgi:hypothetical protein